MDGASTAASLVALVETSCKIVELITAWKEAPEEIDFAKERLKLAIARAKLFASWWTRRQDIHKLLAIPEDVQSLVVQAVKPTESLLRLIAGKIEKKLKKRGRKARISWALSGRKNFKKLLSNLDSVEANLAVLLSIVQMNDNDLQKLELIARQAVAKPTVKFQQVHNHKSRTRRQMMKARIIEERQWDSDPHQKQCRSTRCQWNFGFFNVATVKSSVSTTDGTSHAISLQFRLPFQQVLTADMLLEWGTNYFLSFGKFGDRLFHFRNFVPRDSEICAAAARGDTKMMKKLFHETKTANPSDVTDGNSTLMLLAIDSGNPEAVELLLNEGCDANALFGVNQTSPLAWALSSRNMRVVRLLLSRGADLYHVSAWGWSPVFYLWDWIDGRQESATDFIEALACYSGFQWSHKGLFDIEGFALIHRASICGTPTEIEALLKLGADPFATVGPLEWTTIHNAVFYGRLDTLKTLMRCCKCIDVEDPDVRGWTLLHIAASAGHGDIVEYLLGSGAEPEALSRPSYSHMPKELFGKCCTPAEVARAQSVEREASFLKAVADTVVLRDSLPRS